MNLKPNCFEKTKVRWGIFSFFLLQMLKRRTSALLPITATGMTSGGLRVQNFQNTIQNERSK
jgi:hypothetical protein